MRQIGSQYIYSKMYFEDASALQTHLNNDWAVFLRNLKRKEECHFQLLQYNKKIISKQRNEDDQLFVKDQILQHQQQNYRINQMNQNMTDEQKELIEKYQDCFTSDDEINKLMGRVGARVLETCENFLEKTKGFDKNLIQKYRQMKSQLVKYINQKEEINVQQIIKVVVVYENQKLTEEVKKLKKLIDGLENGQYQRLNQIYIPKPPKPLIIIEKKKDKSFQKPKNDSKSKEIASPIRDEIKKQDRIKKQKQKFASKMTTQLYSTMDISKAQLIQDMTGNVKEKSKQLYNQIFSRNKFNHEQITDFQTKQELFHEKVKIFKEMMEKQSKKIAQVLINTPIKSKEEQERNYANRKNSKDLLQFESYDDGSLNGKKNSNRYRIHSPKGRRDTKDIGNFSMGQGNQNFLHFKFDTTNNEVFARTNRNRLPQLPNFQSNYRGSSLEQRFEMSRSRNKDKMIQKQLKIELENVEEGIDSPREKNKMQKHIQRPRVILKNVEVGVQGAFKRSDPFIHSKDKKKVEPNPMEYTFYVRKSGHRFHQPKINNMII